MTKKKFLLESNQIEKLIPENTGYLSSDKITVDGLKIGYMYRENFDFENDSGWRFFSGLEDQDYADDPNNFELYSLNTIANYDKAIIPYLNLPIGSELQRIESSDKFEIIVDE